MAHRVFLLKLLGVLPFQVQHRDFVLPLSALRVEIQPIHDFVQLSVRLLRA